MAFHLGLTLDAIINICGLAIFAVAAVVVLFMMRGEPLMVTRWRPLVIVVLLAAIVGLLAESFTTTLRVPAVVVDERGVWCAPWSAPVAWANVEDIERIYLWLADEGDPSEAGPLIDVKLVLTDANGAAEGPRPWHGVEHAWIRRALWIWRRSSSAWIDSVFSSGGASLAYCHVMSLDVDAPDMADRFRSQWAQAKQQRDYEEHQRSYEEIRLQHCGCDEETTFMPCSKQVEIANFTCVARERETYRECMNRKLGEARTIE